MSEYNAYDLIAVCDSIIEDGELSGDEVYRLSLWLNEHREACFHWPGSILIKPLQDAWADGKLSVIELRKIGKLLVSIRKEWAKQHIESTVEAAQEAVRSNINAIDLSTALLPTLDCAIPVRSQSDGTTFYEVNLRGPTCTCPDWKSRRSALPARHLTRSCKHVLDAYSQVEPDEGWPGWLGAFVETSYPPHPLSNWLVLHFGEHPVLASSSDGGWANVYAFEGGAYDRFGYNPAERRWSYGIEPRHADQIARAIVKFSAQSLSGNRV